MQIYDDSEVKLWLTKNKFFFVPLVWSEANWAKFLEYTRASLWRLSFRRSRNFNLWSLNSKELPLSLNSSCLAWAHLNDHIENIYSIVTYMTSCKLTRWFAPWERPYYMNTLLTRVSLPFTCFKKIVLCHSFMVPINRVRNVSAADWWSQTHMKINNYIFYGRRYGRNPSEALQFIK